MIWYHDDVDDLDAERRRLARAVRAEQAELRRLKHDKQRIIDEDVSYPNRLTLKSKVRKLLLLIQVDGQYRQLLNLIRSDQLPRPKLRHLMTMVQRAQKHDSLLDFDHQLRLQTLLNSIRRRLPYWEQWTLENDSDEDEDYRVRVRLLDAPPAATTEWRQGIESKVKTIESKLAAHASASPAPKAKKMYESCHYNEDCESELICKENICLDKNTIADDRKARSATTSKAWKAAPPRKKRFDEHCDEPDECKSGYCEDNRCVSKKQGRRNARQKAPMFASCEKASDCASGRCEDDICV